MVGFHPLLLPSLFLPFLGACMNKRLRLGLGPMDWEMGCEQSVHGKIVHAATIVDLE